MGIELLPGECITHIISFTTPKDACRSRVLSNTFRSAADSDNVWREFLPPDCRNLLPHLPRKELYFHLCDHGLLMGDDNSMVRSKASVPFTLPNLYIRVLAPFIDFSLLYIFLSLKWYFEFLIQAFQ